MSKQQLGLDFIFLLLQPQDRKFQEINGNVISSKPSPLRYIL